VVAQHDLVFDRHEMAVLEGHEATRPYEHVLARRRRPGELAGERALAHVKHSGVVPQPRGGDEQRLVVDEEPEHGGVRDVDDRLSGAGEPVCVLGVNDPQVSWRPLMSVPGDCAGRPSSNVPRIPTYPFESENAVSARAK
jgi:hypothetical protein